MGTLHQNMSIPNQWSETGIVGEYSSVQELGGIMWEITLNRSREAHEEYICGLQCLSLANAPVWSCAVRLKLTLESRGVDDIGLAIKKINIKEEQTYTFSRPCTVLLSVSSKDYPDILLDEELLCNVELTVVKSNLQNNTVPYKIDFCSPEMPHDRILHVEGKTFYVQSSILSMCSSFFNNLLRWESDPVPASKAKEITLEDVKAEEFTELLMHLYPMDSTINVSSVASLLKLADRFDIPLVTARCGQFLTSIKPQSMQFLDVVDLVTKYKLVDAQEACIAKLDQYGNVDDMISASGSHRIRYTNMSDEAKVFILEAVLRQRKLPSVSLTGPSPMFGYGSFGAPLAQPYDNRNVPFVFGRRPI